MRWHHVQLSCCIIGGDCWMWNMMKQCVRDRWRCKCCWEKSYNHTHTHWARNVCRACCRFTQCLEKTCRTCGRTQCIKWFVSSVVDRFTNRIPHLGVYTQIPLCRWKTVALSSCSATKCLGSVIILGKWKFCYINAGEDHFKDARSIPPSNLMHLV